MSGEQQTLRQLVLDDVFADRVDLERIDRRARQAKPSATSAQWRTDVFEVIRSLARDGLVDVGHPTLDGGFIELALDEALQRLRDVYFEHYDEPSQWGRCTWLNPTAKGKAHCLNA